MYIYVEYSIHNVFPCFFSELIIYMFIMYTICKYNITLTDETTREAEDKLSEKSKQKKLNATEKNGLS